MARGSSRAIVILGMHRSGTSAAARGLQTLGVHLGDDFLDAQPENPTGYWEDKRIVEIDDRVLKALGLTWDDVAPVDRRVLDGWRLWGLRRDARRHVRANFTMHQVWGFKDPRTLRILPFWERVLRDCNAEDAYLLAIRNPASVASSLFARQRMPVETAERLWLVHLVPFLSDLTGKTLVITDYDLLVQDPRKQLERIADGLHLPTSDTREIDRFAGEFLDANLRHTLFSLDGIDTSTATGRLTREAYALLYDVAADRLHVDSAFWSRWKEFALSLDRLQLSGVEADRRG